MRWRERAPRLALVEPGHAKVLTSAMPNGGVDCYRCDQERLAGIHSSIGQGENYQRHDDDIDGKTPPDPAAQDGVVGRPQVQFRKDEIQPIELSISMEENEDNRHQ